MVRTGIFATTVVAATLGLAVIALLLSTTEWRSTSASASGNDARAVLRDANGQRVGVARLDEDDGEVVVRVHVRNVSPGFHGFHVHSVGECVAPFTSAGGHHNPGSQSHASHAGDMPSLLVNANGEGEARFKTDRFTTASLFDADGSAIIVHAGADNFANIPSRYAPGGPDATTLATGDAGTRFACGVLEGD